MTTDGASRAESGEIGIALVGCGYWGAKLARNVVEAPMTRLVAVHDPNPAHRDVLADRYAAVSLAEFEAVLAHPDVEGVILAGPASTHARQTLSALEAGKHVMVEKPMALSSEDGRRMRDAADERGLVLMVGYTFLFSEPVRRLRAIVAEGKLGRVQYCYSQRLSLGAFRPDMDAIWDLAPHDLSILLYVVDKAPLAVQSQRFSVIEDEQADIGFTTLHCADGVFAHLHSSRLDPRKIRLLTIVGEFGMAVYDDTDEVAPLKIFESSAHTRSLAGLLPPEQSVSERRVELRSGDVTLPKISGMEPLQQEVRHFAECMTRGEHPLTGASFGLRIVEILEAAERSAEGDGMKVELEASDAGSLR